MIDTASLDKKAYDLMDTPSHLPRPVDWDSPRITENLAKRYQRERRFERYGLIAICLAMAALILLGYSIISRGYTAFFQTYLALDVSFDADIIDPNATGDAQTIGRADYNRVIRNALRARFPEARGRQQVRALTQLVSAGAQFDLRRRVMDDPGLIGKTETVWLISSDDVDMFHKGFIDRNVPEADRRLKNDQLAWFDALRADGRVDMKFHSRFFTSGDSREPELAGILGALTGSLYTLLVTLVLAFPIGVTAAVYLEEFAPKNKITDAIEININNLAAVPSIVFGLLGLEVFLNVMHLPRSAPVVGGLTLALMTLPTIIISARAALKAVPPSIRAAALGLGASQVQSVTHHVLPLAMPGILTGTIIGMAQALGETAPLLMIGMVAFIVDIPGGPLDAATVMPVQIYLWADSPERAFVEKTSAAIMVLLAFLVAMNAFAVFLRKKFERTW